MEQEACRVRERRAEEQAFAVEESGLRDMREKVDRERGLEVDDAFLPAGRTAGVQNQPDIRASDAHVRWLVRGC